MKSEKKIKPATNPKAFEQSFGAQKHRGYIAPCPDEPIYFGVKATKTSTSYLLKIKKEQIPCVLHRFGNELIIADYYRQKYAAYFEMEYVPKPSKKTSQKEEIILP